MHDWTFTLETRTENRVSNDLLWKQDGCTHVWLPLRIYDQYRTLARLSHQLIMCSIYLQSINPWGWRAGLVQAVESYRLWLEGPGFESQSPRIAQARVRLATAHWHPSPYPVQSGSSLHWVRPINPWGWSYLTLTFYAKEILKSWLMCKGKSYFVMKCHCSNYYPLIH
jgi:hypothetical protein